MASGTRNWKFVIWQESAPEDFVQRMAASFIRCNMCLHDKDVHADGTPQKPHWDGVIQLDGPMPYDKVMRIMKNIAGDGINTIQECISLSGSLRYICHLSSTEFNEPSEKYQYPTSEVISLNGADYIRDILNSYDVDTYDEEIMRFIEKHDITHYHTLCAATKKDHPEWYRGISSRTMYWRGYVMSRADKNAHYIVNELDDAIKEFLLNGN